MGGVWLCLARKPDIGLRRAGLSADMGLRAWGDCTLGGLAIGVSCGLTVLAARALSTNRLAPLAVSLPFVGAFAAFEAGLYAAGLLLPAGGDEFGLPVIRHVFWVNAAALCGLMVVYQVSSLVGGVAVAKSPQSFAVALR